MKSVVRYISKFEKDTDIFIEVLKFKNEPPLDMLQKFLMKLALCMMNTQ